MGDDAAADRYRPAAIEALQRFGIEGASIDLVEISENVTFRVTDPGERRFVLRMHRPGYHSFRELESESVWLDALQNSGVSVPHPLRATSGHHHVEVTADEAESRYVGVSKWAEGEVVGDLVHSDRGTAVIAEYFSQLGMIMASMHDQASAWSPPAGFERHRVDADGLLGDNPFWGRFWDDPNFSTSERDLLIGARDEIRGTLDQYGQDPQTFSMIHADLHLDNLLVAGDQMSVIDFDDAAFGWHQYDLAVVLFHSRSLPDFEPAEAALLNGYRAVREISDEALALVPMFELIRGMALIGWKNQRPEVDWRGDRFGVLRQHVLESCALRSW